MLRQYEASRFRYETIRGKECRVGTIPVGAIVDLRFNGDRVMVEAWEPRTLGAAVMVNGKWQDRRMRGGHIAHVRSLRGYRRRYRISDAHLRAALGAEDCL